MSDISGAVQGAEELPQGSEETVPQEQPTGQDTKGQGPWAKDLEALGFAPEINQAFDKYLREKLQPRVTELEQQYAPFKDTFQNADDGSIAADLLYSLRNDPWGTYDEIKAIIERERGPREPVQQEETPDGEETPPDDPRMKFVEEQMAEREAAAQMEEFQKLFEEQQKEVPHLTEEWFAKLVLANNGDVEAAMKDHAELFPAKEDPEPPPPTLGEGTTSPPESEQWDSSKESFEAFTRRVLRKM